MPTIAARCLTTLFMLVFSLIAEAQAATWGTLQLDEKLGP
jgi:hypothetical protein